MRNRIIFLLLLLLLPVAVNAYECNDNEIARLRKVASNVTASYDYQEANNNVTFSVTLTNLTNDVYIIDSVTGASYYYNGNNEITINGYAAGTKIKYYIYPTKQNCMESYLNVRYVNLPYYNQYYNSEVCINNTNQLCNKWRKTTLSYEEFVKRIKENNNDGQQEEIQNNEEKNTIFDYVSQFIYEYYVYIIGAGLIVIVIIEFARKKDTFDL